MGGNAAEVADFDMRVEKAALDDAAVADISEITGLSGTFDSLASREIVSLPSASSSGVVPNLAMNWHVVVRQGRLSFINKKEVNIMHKLTKRCFRSISVINMLELLWNIHFKKRFIPF